MDLPSDSEDEEDALEDMDCVHEIYNKIPVEEMYSPDAIEQFESDGIEADVESEDFNSNQNTNDYSLATERRCLDADAEVCEGDDGMETVRNKDAAAKII